MRFHCQQVYSDGSPCKEYSLEGEKYCKWHLTSIALSDAAGRWKWAFVVVLCYITFVLFVNIVDSLAKFLSSAHVMELLRSFYFICFFGLCLSYIMIFSTSSEKLWRTLLSLREEFHLPPFLQHACVIWPKLNLWTVAY